VNPLFCPIRKALVARTPEEEVRQALLHAMIKRWEFPSSLILVEKELQQLPFLAVKGGLPQRRIDILALYHTKEGVRPLLLIECKQKKLTEESVRQLFGYNFYIQAPFIALVSSSKFVIYRMQKETLFPFSEEPFYKKIISKI